MTDTRLPNAKALASHPAPGGRRYVWHDELIAALSAAFSGQVYEENAEAAAGEGEWSWFRWLALTTLDPALSATAPDEGQPMSDEDEEYQSGYSDGYAAAVRVASRLHVRYRADGSIFCRGCGQNWPCETWTLLSEGRSCSCGPDDACSECSATGTWTAPPPDAGQREAQERAGDGVALIAAERLRQVEAEGYTPEHDATHGATDLANAAAVYAAHAYMTLGVDGRPYPRLALWPWAAEEFKPTDQRRDLIKAGALIAAALDVLARADRSPEQP